MSYKPNKQIICYHDGTSNQVRKHLFSFHQNIQARSDFTKKYYRIFQSTNDQSHKITEESIGNSASLGFVLLLAIVRRTTKYIYKLFQNHTTQKIKHTQKIEHTHIFLKKDLLKQTRNFEKKYISEWSKFQICPISFRIENFTWFNIFREENFIVNGKNLTK